MKTTPFTLGSALALALASGCGEFRRGPYEPPPDASLDPALAVCGAYLGGPCNPVTQTGCTGGQACVMSLRPTGELITTCAAPGSGAFASPCATPDSCAAGLVCVDGRCRRLCCPDETDPCAAGVEGTPAVCDRGIGLARANVFACRVACDWRASTCGPDATCIPFDRAGRTDCFRGGSGGDGADCRDTSDCAVGYVCIGVSNQPSTCREICDTSIGLCAGANVCVQVDNAPPGFGICVP